MQTILIVDDHPLFRAAIREIVDRLFADKGGRSLTESIPLRGSA